MSDADDSEPQVEHKKPRLPNACNNCRSRKGEQPVQQRLPTTTAFPNIFIGSQIAIMPGNICSNCIAYKMVCIRDLGKKRGPRIGIPRGQRPIESIVDAILSIRRPFEIPKDPVKVKDILVQLATHIKTLQEDNDRLRQVVSSKVVPSNETTPPSEQEAELSSSSRIINDQLPTSDGYSIEDLTQTFDLLEYDDNCTRHFGSSSSRTFVKAALEIQKEYADNVGLIDARPSFKRLDFWLVQPWQKIKAEKPFPPFEFPPDDLMFDLFDLYFTHLNPIFLILHRPSFLKSVAEGLHHNDRAFGGLVLGVCALGARFSNDTRVLEDYTTSERSSGWKWIRQIQPIRHSYVEAASLSEIQMYLIYITFVGSSTTPEVCWILISIGVRLLQDIGAHRKQPSDSKPTVESESWKRAFWMMNMYDIFVSTMLGRPRCMSQNDFDTELPIDCDDEYWENPDPNLSFQQPPGIPSSTSYWISLLKLMNILGLTLHTIHGVRSSDIWSASVGLTKQEWTKTILLELDSLLNNWINEIPAHLKWDPNRENSQHFDQSVVLYTTYYWIQIMVHRPFIPTRGEDTQPDIPSLAICANAARSCLRILEIQQQRKSNALIAPTVIMSVCHCSIMMLMNMWRRKHLSGSSSSSITTELSGVHRAINALHAIEQRWEYAGRLADILTEVISVSHFQPLSQSNFSNLSLKRPRIDPDNPQAFFLSSPLINQALDREERPIAGSNRVLAALDRVEDPSTQFTLPLNSSELGRLPIHEPLDWNTTQNRWLLPPKNFVDQTQVTDNGSFYPGLSNSTTDKSSEGLEASSFEGFHTSSPPSFPDDWASYMATIDEVLQRATYYPRPD
ncbi:fungal-specific transcription factor domain-containing protein [Lentinula raphanica]|uniref:Fungal-specific transcription factor domain-containing protein n=1 Tax=Lentinula raphanica TaxID=153919 RepID=A0AA38UI59_9AGAR|nr:fungal-specific transcription factor domain-containing protein [Lentinula raphanica]